MPGPTLDITGPSRIILWENNSTTILIRGILRHLEGDPGLSACYVIAAWGGNRRKPDPMAPERDRTFFLREHLARIRDCKRIDRIIVASPKCVIPHKGYEEYLRSLESAHELNGIPLEILRRPNIGMSYGSYNDVYGKYRTSFDYYFVAEDDYLPALPGFDGILLDRLAKSPSCGFLCALSWPNPGAPPHAGIFVGVIRAEVLEKIWVKNGGCLARFEGHDYGEAEHIGQIGISWEIIRAGYELADWTDAYSAPFWWEQGLKVFGNPALPPVYIPGQTLNAQPAL